MSVFPNVFRDECIEILEEFGVDPDEVSRGEREVSSVGFTRLIREWYVTVASEFVEWPAGFPVGKFLRLTELARWFDEVEARERRLARLEESVEEYLL